MSAVIETPADAPDAVFDISADASEADAVVEPPPRRPLRFQRGLTLTGLAYGMSICRTSSRPTNIWRTQKAALANAMVAQNAK